MSGRQAVECGWVCGLGWSDMGVWVRVEWYSTCCRLSKKGTMMQVYIFMSPIPENRGFWPLTNPKQENSKLKFVNIFFSKWAKRFFYLSLLLRMFRETNADFRIRQKNLRPCVPKVSNFKRWYFGIWVLQQFGTTLQVPNFFQKSLHPRVGVSGYVHMCVKGVKSSWSKISMNGVWTNGFSKLYA